MIRSLYAGVSGLRNHQVQMDVIGNNIANVNTVGFKTSRVTFQESLIRALASGTRPHGNLGGINPQLVGVGMEIGSIDTIFTQGNMQATGNVMDLAIEGDAFFIISDGRRELYSRAGNMGVDANGNLVLASTGSKVQGRMADAVGNISSSSPISDVVLSFGQRAPARATNEIGYSGNLDPSLKATAQVLSASFVNNAAITSDSISGDVTIDATNNELEITIDNDAGDTVTETLELDAGDYNIYELAAHINNIIAVSDSLVGEIEAEVENDTLVIKTKDSGGSNTTIELAAASSFTSAVTFSVLTGSGTSESTLLNDMPWVIDDITDGDEIKIRGKNPDGTTASVTFTYGAANDGTTVGDLLDKISDSFSGVAVTLESNGTLRLTDTVASATDTAISLSFTDKDENSLITLPVFSEIVSGKDSESHSTTITVYDSKGSIHSVTITFTNESVESREDMWRWEVVLDSGEITPVSGNKGFVQFNDDGSLASFEVDDDLSLTFEPGEGAATMQIDLDPGEIGSFKGITQLNAPTTAFAHNQNGYGMGDLFKIDFDTAGTITGLFTNGVSQILGQIALASFNNPAGLERVGNNLFGTGANSGTAVRGIAGTTIQATITPGTLEMSTVDLAQEFANMIVAQRGFQANARVITTSDTMLDEIVRLKR